MAWRLYVKGPRTYFLPWGFHLVEDLVPLWNMSSRIRNSNISKEAKLRARWFDYYHQCKNVSLVCRRFGIARKTFYYWKKKYDPFNLKTLEDDSRAPHNTRKPEISQLEEQRIIKLRREYIRWSKFKLAVVYEREYGEKISSWKIQRVIQRYGLYYHPKRNTNQQRRRLRGVKKKRITDLKKKKRRGFLLCLDIKVLYHNSLKRYIFTAIDYYSKIGFAHAYQTKSSKNAQDFLLRLHYLYQGKIENAQTDNGSEFLGYFEKELQRREMQRYFSRVRTPKDNPFNERFNRTLKDEYLELKPFRYDLEEFNRDLTEWLIEYNFRRPHQALGYLTPAQFHFKYHKVLPMYPSNTTLLMILCLYNQQLANLNYFHLEISRL